KLRKRSTLYASVVGPCISILSLARSALSELTPSDSTRYRPNNFFHVSPNCSRSSNEQLFVASVEATFAPQDSAATLVIRTSIGCPDSERAMGNLMSAVPSAASTLKDLKTDVLLGGAPDSGPSRVN